MWIQQQVPINDHLTYLGDCSNGVFLLKGERAMLIGGAMSWVVPSLEKQFSEIPIDPGVVHYLFLSHSHFDHCGAVPYIRKRFPGIKVVASAKAREILAKEKVITFIASVNDRLVDEKGVRDDYERLNMKIENIPVDHVVGDGNTIDLGGGIAVNFIATPGHTECSFSAYVPALKALFPGDALPFPGRKVGILSYPSPQYSFSAYKETVKQLSQYDVDILAYEHRGVMTVQDAKDTLSEALNLTGTFSEYIADLYRNYGDLDHLAARISEESQERSALGHLNAELRLIVAKTLCRSVLKDAGIMV